MRAASRSISAAAFNFLFLGHQVEEYVVLLHLSQSFCIHHHQSLNTHHMTPHHLPAGIYGFSGGKKKHQVFFSEETSHA
jgi:hypothetical protein